MQQNLFLFVLFFCQIIVLVQNGYLHLFLLFMHYSRTHGGGGDGGACVWSLVSVNVCLVDFANFDVLSLGSKSVSACLLYETASRRFVSSVR